MAKANNKPFLSVVVVLISLAFSEGSFVTLNSQVGCNVTLVCNQTGNVTWIYTATSENVEGARFQTQTHAFFSTLSIIDVSKSDNKNITCIAEERNLTLYVAVCYDEIQEQQCKSTIDADKNGQICNNSYMVENCKKSCGFCPEPNCTEAVLPTLPPTTEPNCTEAVLPTLPPTTGSFVTYNTQVGCNVTLVCNQTGNVTWIYTATSENVEGVRFQSQTHAFFSTLSIIDVSKSDNKNVTCMAEERNLTVYVAVCYDEIQEQQCKSTIDADKNGQICNNSYMVENCKKSCGFCPEPNCTEAVLPTLPPTTAKPQTTKDDTNPTTTSRSTVRSSTKDEDQDERDENNGVALGSLLHNAFVSVAASLLAMTILEFLND